MKQQKIKQKTQYIYQVLCQLETKTKWLILYKRKTLHLNSNKAAFRGNPLFTCETRLDPLTISESNTSFQLNVITDSRNKSKRKHKHSSRN